MGAREHMFVKLRKARPSEALLSVAAHAYDLIAELENPAPDLLMRTRAKDNLSAAVRTLSYDERVWLSHIAGRS